MSDVSGGGIDWNGPITIIVTGLVSVLVEYLRRRLPPEPPEPHNRRKDDPKDDDIKELEDDDV